MKKVFLIIIAFFGMGQSTVYGWQTDDSFPVVDAFLDPPYKKIKVGRSSPLQELEATMPDLDSGEIAIFYLSSDGSPDVLDSDSIREFLVIQPSLAIDITQDQLRGNIFLSSQDRQLALQSLGGGINLGHASFELSSTSAKGGVAITSSRGVLGNQQDKSGFNSVAMENVSVIHAGGEGGLKAVTASLGTKQTESHGGTSSVQASIKLSGAADRQGKVYSELVSLFLDRVNRFGKHGSLIDFDTLLAEFGEDYLQIIEELLSITGITGEGVTESLVDEKYFLTSNEVEMFESLIYQDSPLTELLNRPFSQPFREGGLLQRGQPSVNVEYSMLPEPLHHGSIAGLLLSIKNTGDTPLYDMLVVLSVPANTQFFRFIDERPMQKGYHNLYLPGKHYVVMKIYRPLNPGETYKNLAFFNLDPWTLDGAGVAKVESASGQMENDF